jgi:hypothetical protein
VGFAENTDHRPIPLQSVLSSNIQIFILELEYGELSSIKTEKLSTLVRMMETFYYGTSKITNNQLKKLKIAFHKFLIYR